MRVICINDFPTGSSSPFTPAKYEKNILITKGKIYNVINIDSWKQVGVFRILCDNGVINGIAKERFMPLENHRDILLNKLDIL